MRALPLFAGLSFVGLATACGPRPTRLAVPLTYRATSPGAGHGLVASVSPDVRLYLAPIVDGRSSAEVGENIETKPYVRVVAKGSPARFVQDVAEKELSSSGYRLVGAASANRVLALTLTRFFTTESSTYTTEVRAEIEVRSAGGVVLFHGAATGSDSRFGRSLSAENYEETWSAATLDLVRSIVGSGQVVSALTQAAPAQAPVAPPPEPSSPPVSPPMLGRVARPRVRDIGPGRRASPMSLSLRGAETPTTALLSIGERTSADEMRSRSARAGRSLRARESSPTPRRGAARSR